MSNDEHTWPEEHERLRLHSRCSICGARRFSEDSVQRERAAAPCPGRGADGVKFRERPADE